MNTVEEVQSLVMVCHNLAIGRYQPCIFWSVLDLMAGEVGSKGTLDGARWGGKGKRCWIGGIWRKTVGSYVPILGSILIFTRQPQGPALACVHIESNPVLYNTSVTYHVKLYISTYMYIFILYIYRTFVYCLNTVKTLLGFN